MLAQKLAQLTLTRRSVCGQNFKIFIQNVLYVLVKLNLICGHVVKVFILKSWVVFEGDSPVLKWQVQWKAHMCLLLTKPQQEGRGFGRSLDQGEKGKRNG